MGTENGAYLMGLAEFIYEEAERRNSKYEESCPRCFNCGEPITSDIAWEIDGHLYCEECIDDAKVFVERE